MKSPHMHDFLQLSILLRYLCVRLATSEDGVAGLHPEHVNVGESSLIELFELVE